MQRYNTFLIFGICLLLSSCGFQLRPPANLPSVMRHTFIASRGSDDSEGFKQMNDVQLVRELTRSLTTPTTAITKNATNATAVLYILKSKRFERVLSVSNTGQPLVKEVAYEVEFSLATKDGKTLIEPQKLILKRDYNYSTGNVIGDTEQANVLYKAMVHDMVQLIIFRLEALNRKSTKK